ncbi:DoxX family protein [Streptomyces sp. NBC_00669]|uniref:DoxX family protein n=1 Tax=Streptomyces sp. NBC_00669 TaxID=2976011 RepID=UPI003FA6B331
MSVDTRTPRTSTGGGAPGFDERVMTMARVPSDPAQVIVNHASFRVQLGAASTRALGVADTVRMPSARRGKPVVWSGHTSPELTQAVRRQAGAAAGPGSAGAATQVLPRIDDTSVLPAAAPTVIGQRAPFDEPLIGRSGRGYDDRDGDGPDSGDRGRARGRRGDAVRHAYYPHRRMNLGIVLLPLRVFLGFVSIYAGMGKLCDRVYFDGGHRGSMVKWLSSLHPWGAAEPLRDAALNHPVGAGLSIAFLQVVVGVLTVFGLWQRIAAAFGAAVSIALLVTVSWRTVPVYDAPDFIYLAAWSPLVIAGAPVYSIDGHLASDAWRRLGPRVTLWDLRRRVLRRGAVLATVTIGLTLLVGSVLGAAVRSSSTEHGHSGPASTPVNNLPGSPLPEVSGGDSDGGTTGASADPTRSSGAGKHGKGGADGAQPGAEPSHTHSSVGSTAPQSTHTTIGTGGGSTGSGTGTGSGSGGSSGGSSGSSPVTHAPPPAETQAPPPPAPPAKPSQGAIGGLLGSGPLLGLSAGPAGHSEAPQNMA